MIKFSYIMINGHGSEIVSGDYPTAKAAREAGMKNNQRQEYLGVDEFSPMFDGRIEKSIILTQADRDLQLERKRAKAVCKPLYQHPYLNNVLTRPLDDSEINALTKQDDCFCKDDLVF